MHSMTAFAQAKTNTKMGELSCEIRSVNHRFLEIAPRMPEIVRVFESQIREAVTKNLSRGRVDVFIRLAGAEQTQSELDLTALANLKALSSQVSQEFGEVEPLRTIDVLQWPGVMVNQELDQAHLKTHLFSVVEEALLTLLRARSREGEKLAGLVRQRVEDITEIIKTIRGFLPELEADQRNRLDKKLADVVELDAQRLEQEIALLLNKSDVAEELDRLEVHLSEVLMVLDKSQPVGRRLDFLMQELNREANTLGSKSSNTELTKASVDIKVLIEQMREQVQNIE